MGGGASKKVLEDGLARLYSRADAQVKKNAAEKGAPNGTLQEEEGAPNGTLKEEEDKENIANGATEKSPDVSAVKAHLEELMKAPSHDDGSFAPLFLRMAWHSSGTYNEKEGTGGSNGATMRFAPEKDDPENNGLGYARELLAKVHQDFPQLSLADIYVLAGCVALEVTGGPEVAFTPGRTDAPEGSVGCPHGLLPMAEFHLKGPPGEDGRIPGWEKLAAHIRDIFGRMGFTDREMVALISGGHTYGRCHPEHSGYAGVWIENPLEFSNEYCADMFEDEWIAVTHDTVMPDGGSVPDEVRPAEGKWQYINLSKYEALAEEPEAVQQMMLVSDMVLLWDEGFKEPLKEYAEDPELMKTEFGVAFKKLTELGCPFAKKS